MRLHHVTLIALLCCPLFGWAQTPDDLREWKALEAKAVAALPDVVRSYANSIGCNVSFESSNIARWTGNPAVHYIALVTLDEGCSGGTRSWRSIIVAVRRGANAALFINPDYSLPMLTSEEFPQMIDTLSATKDGVRFVGRSPQGQDSSNNPSRPITGKVVWTGEKWATRD